MLNYKFLISENSLEIEYLKEKSNIFDYFHSISIDLLLLILSIFTISGLKYISGFLDFFIIIFFILIFTILQLLNIKINMKHEVPTIENLELQITNMNRAIGFFPILFIIIGAPTIVYPIFLGAFIYSNGFNLLMHLQTEQTSFLRIATKVGSDQVIIETRSELFRMSGKWKQSIPLKSQPLYFRVKEVKNKFGFKTTVFLSKDAFHRIRDKEPTKNTIYSLHFLRGEELGLENIKNENDGSIYFIGRTQKFVEIRKIINRIQSFKPTEFYIFDKI